MAVVHKWYYLVSVYKEAVRLTISNGSVKSFIGLHEASVFEDVGSNYHTV